MLHRYCFPLLYIQCQLGPSHFNHLWAYRSAVMQPWAPLLDSSSSHQHCRSPFLVFRMTVSCVAHLTTTVADNIMYLLSTVFPRVETLASEKSQLQSSGLLFWNLTLSAVSPNGSCSRLHVLLVSILWYELSVHPYKDMIWKSIYKDHFHYPFKVLSTNPAILDIFLILSMDTSIDSPDYATLLNLVYATNSPFWTTPSISYLSYLHHAVLASSSRDIMQGIHLRATMI